MSKIRKFPARKAQGPFRIEPVYNPAYYQIVSLLATTRLSTELDYDPENIVSPHDHRVALDELIHKARMMALLGAMGPKMTAAESGYNVGTNHRGMLDYDESESYLEKFSAEIVKISGVGNPWMADTERERLEYAAQFREGYRRGYRGKPAQSVSDFGFHPLNRRQVNAPA